MKKVLVVDFAACEGGALSVLKDYYNQVKNDKNNFYYFLLNDYYFDETDNIKIIVLKKYKRRINRLYFDYIVGRKYVKHINPNEILSLQNTIIRGTKVKQSVFIHQAIPFQTIKNFSFFIKNEIKYAIIQHLIGKVIISSAKKADKVIVQTKWMKEAIIDKCGIKPEKVEIHFPEVKIGKIKSIKKEKDNVIHFFYPTSDDLYKNNEIIFDCVNQLITDGITNFVVEMTINGESSKYIKKIGRISREDVISRYYDSILLFPSYIETLGLPLLEAKLCNSTIIASNTAFSHELLNNYNKASFFNPFSVDELKRVMIKQIKNEGEKNI